MEVFVSASEFSSGLGRIEGTGLTLAGQSHSDGRDKCITDNGVINMFTGDSRNLFNLKFAPFGRECAQIGNDDFLRVLCVGSLNLVFHMETPAGESDFHVQLPEVYVLNGLSFSLLSLHHAQCKQHIVLNNAGVHLFDGRRVFPRGVNGSSLSATRLPPSVLNDGITSVCGSPPASLPPSSVESVVPSPPSGFQPAFADIVPSPPPGFQSTISGVVPFTVPSFQPVLTDVVASSLCGFSPASANAASVVSQALDPTAPCEIQPFEPFNDLRLMDTSVFLDVCLMGGKDSVPPEDPPPSFHQ